MLQAYEWWSETSYLRRVCIYNHPTDCASVLNCTGRYSCSADDRIFVSDDFVRRILKTFTTALTSFFCVGSSHTLRRISLSLSMRTSWSREQGRIQKLGLGGHLKCPFLEGVESEAPKALKGWGWGVGIPIPSRLGGLRQRHKLPSGFGAEPGRNCKIWMPKKSSGGTYFTIFAISLGGMAPCPLVSPLPVRNFWGCK